MNPNPVLTSAAPAPALTVNPKLRVSLFGDYVECWQGTLGEFCFRTETDPASVMSAAAAKEGFTIAHAAIADLLPFVHGVRFPCENYVLRLTHYYKDTKTGSAYTNGNHLRRGWHWDRQGPICVTIGQTQARTPLVDFHTAFGFDASYTPAQIRAFAATLLTIADDAEKAPMGKRSFCRSVRGYDT